MGARQSKRSVDITTTPKKEGLPAEGGVGDAAAPGDGKLERIEETDTKPTTNGIGPHTETVDEKNQEETAEKEKEEVKVEETKAEATPETPAEVAEVTTPTETTPASQTTARSPENKETKKKEKSKKLKFSLSFRTLSFGKKDKTKPPREDTPKNGDVAKEEPLVEGGEEAENATATASSPNDKSEVSSPVECEAAPAPATEAKEVEKPAEEKKEEAASAEKEKPTEKVETAAVAEKVESIPEPEAPVENNVSANEVSTTETVDEAPKSPPPAVPVEVTIQPAPAPVITEDVASVTKAIEEVDINEKAVAAAVKEGIENSNANEIVVDSNHQNHLNE